MVIRGYKSERVVLPHGVEPAVVLVRDGVVESVVTGAQARSSAGDGVSDLGSRLLAPGLVDCHVHVNEPGRTAWEGFETATRAAAAGGVTTIVDMPLNSVPATTSGSAFDAKLVASRGRCFVDVGFWGGVVPGNARELPALAARGALGCKAFLVHSGVDDFPNVTESDLLEAMPVLRDHGLPLLAHAELDRGAAVQDPQARSYRSYLDSRPPAWEDDAIRLLVALCRRTGCPVHVVHLSSASSVGTLRAAKAEGLPVTVETCPHYLCFEAGSIPDGATLFKCAPPIRDRANREALWDALFEGVVDFIITDHSPCAPELKLPESGDFQNAWGGIASLQVGLAAVWTEARRRGADVTQIFQWMSGRPATFAGLAATKGRIAPGYDADFVVWDPDDEFVLQSEDLHFRHKVSPYVGARLTGRVCQTILRGRMIFDRGAHAAETTGRQLLHRGPSTRADAASGGEGAS